MKTNICIILAKYYPNISENLLRGASQYLKKNKKKFKIIETTGVFEIPVIISRNIKKFDAFIALGCVIKGQTPHFDFISQSTTDALMNLAINNKKPIGNGIITCLNMNQAVERSHHKKKNKGREAANAVLSVLGS